MRHTQTVPDVQMQQCIDNCRSAHQICVETMYHCLSKGGEHSDPSHIGLLIDCAQINEMNADFMSRNSEFHTKMCELCADIDEKTAKDCDMMSKNDDQMRACVEETTKSMNSCRMMAKQL